MLVSRPTPIEWSGLIADVLAWLDRAGYPDAFPAVRENHAAAERIAAAARDADDPKAVLAALGAALLDGELGAADAAEQLATANDRDAAGVQVIASQAVRTATARAWAALAGPAIVTDYLRPHVEGLATEAARHAKVIPTHVTTDAQAISGGPKIASAWASLTEQAAWLADAWQTLDVVVREGIVEYLPWDNDLDERELRYADTPEQADADTFAEGWFAAAPHPVVALLTDLQRGPSAWTPAEAIARRKATAEPVKV